MRCEPATCLLTPSFFPRVLYCLSHLSESVCVLGGLPPGGPYSALSAPVISHCTHSPFVDFTCKSHVNFFSPWVLKTKQVSKGFFFLSRFQAGFKSCFLSMVWNKDVKCKIRKQKMEEYGTEKVTFLRFLSCFLFLFLLMWFLFLKWCTEFFLSNHQNRHVGILSKIFWLWPTCP